MSSTSQPQIAVSQSNPTILEVDHLSIAYPISIGIVRAVEDVSITLADGEALGLVGESGCGKSTLGLSILKLLRPPGRVTAGRIRYRGKDILGMSQRALLALRGQNIAMIFQNPLTSLNPLFTVERHFLETIHFHDPGMPQAEGTRRRGEDPGVPGDRAEAPGRVSAPALRRDAPEDHDRARAHHEPGHPDRR